MAKRLYKSQEKKLCGVCAGIAEYFNIDPTIVRLIWVVITCASVGGGLVAYVICALIMPDRPSSSSDWNNMKRANDTSDEDREFNSHFEKK
ncbi:MAG: PspC domain-containing protein [Treponema sp.]|nr:PspC domain-containing protein [Treponema sp.]